MIQRICPVCEQVMKSAHYCRNCRKWVRHPRVQDVNYYLNERRSNDGEYGRYHNIPDTAGWRPRSLTGKAGETRSFCRIDWAVAAAALIITIGVGTLKLSMDMAYRWTAPGEREEDLLKEGGNGGLGDNWSAGPWDYDGDWNYDDEWGYGGEWNYGDEWGYGGEWNYGDEWGFGEPWNYGDEWGFDGPWNYGDEWDYDDGWDIEDDYSGYKEMNAEGENENENQRYLGQKGAYAFF